MNFEFATTTRILFGVGRISQAGKTASEFGRRALLIHGSDIQRSKPVQESLTAAGITVTSFQVLREPTLDDVRAGADLARRSGCELVLGFGGGSVLDAGKAIAAMATNPGDILDYVEVVGRGQSINIPALPILAIPTTAGTGTEVTRNAVLSVPEQRVKVSLRSGYIQPRLAIVDPALTCTQPAEVTASSGLDALTQLIEPFVSVKANPLTDAVCREGIRRAARSLLRAYEAPKDVEARQDLALASLFSGIALANAKLGAVHGLASVLGGYTGAPHGVICARLLPLVTAANIRRLQAEADIGDTLAKYQEIAGMVLGNPDARLDALVAWVKDICARMKIPQLSRYGLKRADFPEVIEKTLVASSTKGNPVKLSPEEFEDILAATIDENDRDG